MVYIHHGARTFPGLVAVSSACTSGLQIFFFLSSYLITELLLREKERTQTINVKSFFVRRILRIWPLYFFAIGMCVILSRATARFGGVPSSAIAYFLLLGGNWWIAQHGWLASFIGPLWSISLEEQYYLLWPFVGRAGYKRGLWLVSSIALVTAYLALIYLGRVHAPRSAVWANSFVEFQFFSLGAMTALLLHGRDFVVASGTRVIFLIMGVALIAAAWRLHITNEFLGQVRFLLAGYFCLAVGVVFIFLVFYGLTVPRWCGPLLFFGKISYGLYVFHYLALGMGEVVQAKMEVLSKHALPHLPSETLRLLFSLLLCMLLASISHRFLEKPFLRLKDRFALVKTRAN